MVCEPIQIRVFGPEAWPEIAPRWDELAASLPDTSFFLTTVWIGSWLEVFSQELNVSILLFNHGETTVGGCLLVGRTDWRGPVAIRRLFLNATGEDEADETLLEFNDLICLPGCEQAVAEALARYVQETSWDEFTARLMCPTETTRVLRAALVQGGLTEMSTDVPSFYVDLVSVRERGGRYDEILGQPTRKHLRQNLRHYARNGAIRLEAAGSTEEALTMLEGLASLHQESWTGRGKPGVFASSRFITFHRKLIERSFGAGAIQLLRVSSGGQTFGMLYNFIHWGKVYFYQSGFSYADKKLSPGTVTIFQAIQHCLSSPELGEFNFMGGDSQYKRSLSTHAHTLVTSLFQRPNLRNDAVRVLSGMKRLFHN